MSPILILRRRRYHFAWTTLASPVNDALRCVALRCVALCTASNDDDWRGRVA